MAPAFETADARNALHDLSGIVIKPGENPYTALIKACDDDPAKIQSLYSTHRVTRNAQQRDKFLDPAFTEVITDPILLRIEHPSIDPAFTDERHGLVFWARPPEHVLKLAGYLQGKLREAAPHIWLMPPQCMHMTALEITHSRTPAESDALVQAMKKKGGDGSGEKIANYCYRNRARLVKPMLSYDLMAIALSYVPAAGEKSMSPPPVPPGASAARGEAGPRGSSGTAGTGSTTAAAGSGTGGSSADEFTYHHLRRDLFNIASTSTTVASRYVVPSAHITLARFIDTADHTTPQARQKWVDTLDNLNAWLEQEVWDAAWAVPPGAVPPEPSKRFVGEWVVGQERGLDMRTGALWYGGGRSVMVGEGF